MIDTPNIRFKGFIDPWEQRKLSDEFSDFIVPMRDKPKEFGGNIPWTRIEDIEGKYLNGTLSEQYVTEVTVKEMNLKIIPKDSLIVSSSATFGVVAVVTQDLITNQTFIGLVPNNKNTLDYWYAFFYSDNARKYMRLQSAGSTIFYISRESFENMPIKIPSEEEMIRIGAYFDKLDNLITLHQRKCDEMSELKKYMLQKMFPKKGEQFPEIRFDGFTDPWEQRKLSDVAEIIGGGTPSTNKPEYWDGNIDWYAPAEINGQIYVDGSERKITKLGLEKSSARLLPAYRTVLFTSRAGIGKTAILRRSGTTNQGFQSIILNDDTNPYFVFSMTDMIKEKAERVASGSTFAEISGKMLGNLEFMFPEKLEQDRIGAYFESLDNLITLHQRKCDELKEFKKFMLQNMFPKKG